MTPIQKLKWLIINEYYNQSNTYPLDYPCDNIDDIFQNLEDEGELSDTLHEVRPGTLKTDIPTKYSRHYESYAVASKLPDNTWVGWTYWYGGGKHGEPEAIDWIQYAYDVSCVEEEKLVVIQTFTKL